MGTSKFPPFAFVTFFSFSVLVLLSRCFSLAAAADTNSLIYKGCATQTYTPNSGFQETLSSLFNSLVAQAATARFFKTTAAGGQASLTGLYQCRGDLNNADCYSCVRRLPQLVSGLCGQSVAGRVQVAGCYLAYQTADFPQISGTEMLYKMCSSSEARGAGFEEKRDTALNQLQTGISGGSGFYATAYSAVYAIAQCQGDLSGADCNACVKAAVQKSEVECGSSIAGQVYLNRCYISYNYYPNGVNGGGGDGGGHHTSGELSSFSSAFRHSPSALSFHFSVFL